MYDSGDDGVGEWVCVDDEVVEIDFWCEVYFVGDCWEDKVMFMVVMEWGEFNFMIEMIWMEECRVECVCVVGCYDDFDVGGLVEVVYLVE